MTEDASKTDAKPLVYVGFAGDIIHHGHINIIRVAASLGRCVIGLLTDEAIATYKRTTIIKWHNRKKVVESLVGVAEVIPQYTHDYSANLIKLKPAFVVHGTDWREGKQALVRQKVIDLIATWGGKLVEPEYTSDISTTDIINRCHDYEQKRRSGEPIPRTVLEQHASLPALPSSLSDLASLRPIAYVGVGSDIIHHGHIHVINEARKLGTVVIGLLSDEAVASYRGKPAVSFAHRVTIFQNVVGVHAVIPQQSLNYEANLDLLRPEFVVHGDNWRTDHQRPVREAVVEQLSAWGGKLVEPAFADDADPGLPAPDSPTRTQTKSGTADDAKASSESGKKKGEDGSFADAISARIVDTCFQRIQDQESRRQAVSPPAPFTPAPAMAAAS